LENAVKIVIEKHSKEAGRNRTKRVLTFEFIVREKKNGLTVFKWKDKRDILLFSTKHSIEMVYIHRKRNSRYKPAVIVDYKAEKDSADLSDKMIAYCNHYEELSNGM